MIVEEKHEVYRSICPPKYYKATIVVQLQN